MKFPTKKQLDSLPFTVINVDNLEFYARHFSTGFSTEVSKDETSADFGKAPLSQVGDFTLVPVRALSGSMIERIWTDFSKGSVLQDSVNLLNGRTIYKDHNKSVDLWVGKVQSTSWDPIGVTSKNVPGVNAVLAVDRTVDPKLVRGLELGILDSVSVGIRYKAEPTHPALYKKDLWAYYFDHLGTKDDNGNIIGFNATKILEYSEISFVWKGQDPLAKTLSADLSDTPSVVESLFTLLGVNTEEGVLEGIKELLNKEVTPDSAMLHELGLPVSLAEAQVKMKDLFAKELIANEYVSDLQEKVRAAYRIAELQPGGTIPAFVEVALKAASVADLKEQLSHYETKGKNRFPANGFSYRPETTPTAAQVTDVGSLHV